MSTRVPLDGTSDAPLPLRMTSTTPRQKNWVPMVATSEGMPTFVTIMPLAQPAKMPAARQPMKASSVLWVVVNTSP